MAAQVKSMGGEPDRYPITKDDFNLICERVQEAAEAHDLVLLNAGSSAGAGDFSARVVEKLGVLLVHGVAVRPGHPVILGLIKRKSSNARQEAEGLVPIVGVPGYPVSAALTIDIFVEPVLARWLGRKPIELPVQTATLTRKIVSPVEGPVGVRCRCGIVEADSTARPDSE